MFVHACNVCPYINTNIHLQHCNAAGIGGFGGCGACSHRQLHHGKKFPLSITADREVTHGRVHNGKEGGSVIAYRNIL